MAADVSKVRVAVLEEGRIRYACCFVSSVVELGYNVMKLTEYFVSL